MQGVEDLSSKKEKHQTNGNLDTGFLEGEDINVGYVVQILPLIGNQVPV
jgi:hypothetical protein